MVDGFRDGIWLNESIEVARILESE